MTTTEDMTSDDQERRAAMTTPNASEPRSAVDRIRTYFTTPTNSEERGAPKTFGAVPLQTLLAGILFGGVWRLFHSNWTEAAIASVAFTVLMVLYAVVYQARRRRRRRRLKTLVLPE